jgi:hypothetical protein
VRRGIEALNQNDFEGWFAIASTEIKLYPPRGAGRATVAVPSVLGRRPPGLVARPHREQTERGDSRQLKEATMAYRPRPLSLLAAVLACAALGAVLPAAAATAAGARAHQPSVTIVEACNFFPEAPFAIGYSFTGGQPGEVVSVVIYFDDGDFIVGSTGPLDAQGSTSSLPAAAGRGTPLGLVTVEVYANPDELSVFPLDPSLRLLAAAEFANPCEGPARPTSKDQCRNGGWRDFGVFKNQGDCVSFVATEGKNPPGH